MIARNDACWCGSGRKWKMCHYPKKGIKGGSLKEEYFRKYGILLKDEAQMKGFVNLVILLHVF